VNRDQLEVLTARPRLHFGVQLGHDEDAPTSMRLFAVR